MSHSKKRKSLQQKKKQKQVEDDYKEPHKKDSYEIVPCITKRTVSLSGNPSSSSSFVYSWWSFVGKFLSCTQIFQVLLFITKVGFWSWRTVIEDDSPSHFYALVEHVFLLSFMLLMGTVTGNQFLLGLGTTGCHFAKQVGLLVCVSLIVLWSSLLNGIRKCRSQFQLLRNKVASGLLWCDKTWNVIGEGIKGILENLSRLGKRNKIDCCERPDFNMASSVQENTPPWEMGSIAFPRNSHGRGGRPELGCHIAWIDEMIPDLLAPEMKEKLFKGVLDTVSDWIKDSSDIIVSGCTVINTRLMMAAFNAYLSEYSEALDWLTEALALIKKTSFQRTQHDQAYHFLIAANFSLITEMLHLQTGSREVEDSHKVLQSLPTTFDKDDDKFQSVLVMSKGMLAYQMRCEDSQLFNFRKATILDPDTAEWHRSLYKGLRTRRRKLDPGSGPTKEEVDAITKAYDLDSDCCLNQTQYACMLDEQLKGRRDYPNNETKESVSEEIIDLIVKAIEKNPEDKWAHVRLAEVYGYGTYPNLDKDQGEILFLECEERWPNSSMVLHKFGKYYQKSGNWTKALDYFTRGLDADLENFPCLMDCLKCVSKYTGDQTQLLHLVDRCLPVHCFNKLQVTTLLLAKGLLFWKMNDTDGTKKMEACDLWVEAAMKNPTGPGRYTIVQTITRGFWDILGKYTVEIPELIDILIQMLPLPDADSCTDNKKKKAIKNLLDELRSIGSRRPVRMPAFHQYNASAASLRHRSSSVSSIDSTISTNSSDSYLTAKSFWSDRTSRSSSVVDGDYNWRFGSAPETNGILSNYQQQPRDRLNYFSASNSSAFKPASARGMQTKGPSNKSYADVDSDWRR
ncbi:unnamed protein product [Orchesella dallaii]|uniref:Uncharacterized protein n=1 Tax=Orchesella dallaii TaxID=48710 RepID=A0ABP1RCQ7_9HEXA